MPKRNKARVAPKQTEQTADDAATTLMPPPAPRSPKRSAPVSVAHPCSPGKQALNAAKADVAIRRREARESSQKLRNARTAFACARTLFDGQMVRLGPEMKNAKGIEAWNVEHKIDRATNKFSEAYQSVQDALFDNCSAE